MIPSKICPICFVEIQQISSATIELAVWQHLMSHNLSKLSCHYLYVRSHIQAEEGKVKMTPEHELLTKWIKASAQVDQTRRHLREAEDDHEESEKDLAAVEAELYKLVPEKKERLFLFQGQLIKVSRSVGFGGIGMDSVYVVADVEKVEEE